MNLDELLSLSNRYEKGLPDRPPELPLPQGVEVARWIDHTLLKPEATAFQIKTLCQEALEYHFATVCVNPIFLPLVKVLLSGSDVRPCAVIGFPLGATMPTQKTFETLSCLEVGAQEIDMVINIGGLKGEAYGYVLNDIHNIVELAHNHGALVKVILETALLTRREKIIACLLSQVAGADYVETSTGFVPGGATTDDVDLMFRLVGPSIKVKATGGIHSLSDSIAMIRAGASRIETSSGVKIVNDAGVDNLA